MTVVPAIYEVHARGPGAQRGRLVSRYDVFCETVIAGLDLAGWPMHRIRRPAARPAR